MLKTVWVVNGLQQIKNICDLIVKMIGFMIFRRYANDKFKKCKSPLY